LQKNAKLPFLPFWFGIDCYDRCTGNDQHAGCSGIIPCYRADASNGQLGKNIRSYDELSIGVILSVSRVVNARIKKEELSEEEISDEGEKIYEPAKA